jgi:hypothetical protein
MKKRFNEWNVNPQVWKLDQSRLFFDKNQVSYDIEHYFRSYLDPARSDSWGWGTLSTERITPNVWWFREDEHDVPILQSNIEHYLRSHLDPTRFDLWGWGTLSTENITPNVWWSRESEHDVPIHQRFLHKISDLWQRFHKHLKSPEVWRVLNSWIIYLGGAGIISFAISARLLGKTLRLVEYPNGNLTQIVFRGSSIQRLKEHVCILEISICFIGIQPNPFTDRSRSSTRLSWSQTFHFGYPPFRYGSIYLFFISEGSFSHLFNDI